MTCTLCHPSTWTMVTQLHRELETSLGYIRLPSEEIKLREKRIGNVVQRYRTYLTCMRALIQLVFSLLLPLPSPLFLSLCPLPHTQSQVWTDRCTQLECSGRASRKTCHLGKVDEIKDKWPSDKKVESRQNVSQRGIPNSSPVVHP